MPRKLSPAMRKWKSMLLEHYRAHKDEGMTYKQAMRAVKPKYHAWKKKQEAASSPPAKKSRKRKSTKRKTKK